MAKFAVVYVTHGSLAARLSTMSPRRCALIPACKSSDRPKQAGQARNLTSPNSEAGPIPVLPVILSILLRCRREQGAEYSGIPQQ